jgi:hypothetical protein
MTRKPKWQEQVEEKIERALEPATASTQAPKAEEREPDFCWYGRPVYRCRECGDKYERVENLESVLRHEEEVHGGAVRQSSILGADGKPLTVLEA